MTEGKLAYRNFRPVTKPKFSTVDYFVRFADDPLASYFVRVAYVCSMLESQTHKESLLWAITKSHQLVHRLDPLG